MSTELGEVPGQGHLGPTVDRFDEWADRRLDRWRGRPVLDATFRIASAAGDFSMVWQVVNVARGLAKRRPDQMVLFAVMLGAESLLVNQGVKRLFRRQRPTRSGDPGLRVRQPATSAFPSGHASSGAFAATVLTGWDRGPAGRIWWAVAAVVGTSRAYVRVHHASDVVAGALLGWGLGRIGRRVAKRVLAR